MADAGFGMPFACAEKAAGLETSAYCTHVFFLTYHIIARGFYTSKFIKQASNAP